MSLQPFFFAVTVVNFVMLTFVLIRVHPVVAQDVTQVLRGRALEIVDERGRVRASIKVQPAEVSTANGKAYPETVIL